MRRKVLATALCAAIMVIAMGFVVVAKTADASLKPEGNFRTFAKATDSVASSSNADEDEQDEDVAEDVTDEVVVTDEKAVIKDAEMDDVASPSKATYVSTEEELGSALKKSGTIILGGDIQVTDSLWTSKGVDIAIDGAGHKIELGDNSNLESILNVDMNAEVSLQDITIDATGMDYDGKLGSGIYIDYYAIHAMKGSELTIKDGTNIICNDREEGIEIKNQRKGGIWLSGAGVMNGGEISGFYQGGISVGKGAKFTLENGAISQILEGSDGGGGAINIVGGTATINGGTLSDSSQGIFNNSNLIMTGGDITGNQFGLINNNKDGMSGETFTPVAKLSGGSIANNEVYAIKNYKGGTFTVTGDAYVSGRVISNLSLFSKKQKSNLPSVIISNETGATLNIEGGRIESNSPNEIAVYNDKESFVKMSGGVVSVNGAGSVAIQNDNSNTKAVVLQDGSLNIGEGSNAMVGSGNTEVGDGIIVNAEGRVMVKGTSDENGWVTPALTVAKIGDSVDFTIKAYPGYRISDVKVNGVSVGAVSQYTLVVAGADVLEAQFVQSSSSGGSGGSGGSGRIITGNSATMPSIPETPGAWVQDQTGWKFNAPNQTPYVNTWIRSRNQWYWVGVDSYMRTGWNQISEKWYYLMPVTGEMKTGWLQDGDSWYDLDETGARKTGWIQDGTKWYYLNQDGKMAANTTTPDGYKVDGSGAWVK